MAGLRFSILKSLRSCTNLYTKPQSFHSSNFYVKSANHTDGIHVRTLYAYVNRHYQVKEAQSFETIGNTREKVLGLKSRFDIRCYTATRSKYAFSPTLSHSHFGRAIPVLSVSPLSKYCSYSSSSSSNAEKGVDQGVSASSGASEVNVSDGVVGNDWLDKIKDVWQSAVDAATYTGQKAKEASVELSPHVEQLLDSHPYLKNVVVPVSITFTGTLLAWFVMPRILRRFHKYATQGPVALLSGSLSGEEVPYEKSFWGALEDPVRYLITFMAFTQMLVVPRTVYASYHLLGFHVLYMPLNHLLFGCVMWFSLHDTVWMTLICSGMMVAPTTIASQYLSQTWRGAVILSFVWFLHRWKTNVFARALASPIVAGLDREKLLALDKISSVGLFVIGIMALAEACGVAVQSVLTVGGIGGQYQPPVVYAGPSLLFIS